MVSTHLPAPVKPLLLKNAALLLTIVISLLSLGFTTATNNPLGWIGLLCFVPYAAYQCYGRLNNPQDRYNFLLVLWVLLGLPFTFNVLDGSLWWLAYWPVTFLYWLVFGLININKA